jgi:hypothetical protein
VSGREEELGGDRSHPPSTRRNLDLNFHLDCFTGRANFDHSGFGICHKALCQRVSEAPNGPEDGDT